MSVGDIQSAEKGSGARFNTGKAPLELIPLRILAEQQYHLHEGVGNPATDCLWALAMFQEGGNADNLYKAIAMIGPAWDECAAVFEYGKAKYAAWNWAKGMAWSVPIACAARHILFGILAGEQIDPESKKSHRGHILCNIVMLLTYLRTYPEGDDRPTEWLGLNSKESE